MQAVGHGLAIFGSSYPSRLTSYDAPILRNLIIIPFPRRNKYDAPSAAKLMQSSHSFTIYHSRLVQPDHSLCAHVVYVMLAIVGQTSIKAYSSWLTITKSMEKRLPGTSWRATSANISPRSTPSAAHRLEHFKLFRNVHTITNVSTTLLEAPVILPCHCCWEIPSRFA